MRNRRSTDVRNRILDAAERAFAQHGFEAASMRDIVRRARVTLPTLYYYFGSKSGLMAAVFSRRFDWMRQEHLAALDQLQRQAKGQPPSLEQLLEAMIRPPLRLAWAATRHRSVVMRLIGRIVAEPDPRIQGLIRSQYADVRTAFLDALAQALPHLPQQVLYWRYMFTWGALAFILSNPSRLEQETNGLCDPRDAEAVLSQMIAFFAAGLRAPTPQAPGSSVQPSNPAISHETDHTDHST